jgi:hypothetical protein
MKPSHRTEIGKHRERVGKLIDSEIYHGTAPTLKKEDLLPGSPYFERRSMELLSKEDPQFERAFALAGGEDFLIAVKCALSGTFPPGSPFADAPLDAKVRMFQTMAECARDIVKAYLSSRRPPMSLNQQFNGTAPAPITTRGIAVNGVVLGAKTVVEKKAARATPPTPGPGPSPLETVSSFRRDLAEIEIPKE